MDMEDEFVGSSYHLNNGRRMMTSEEEDSINWENISGSKIQLSKTFSNFVWWKTIFGTKLKRILEHHLKTTIPVGVDVAPQVMW